MAAIRRDLLRDRSWMNYNSASDRRKPDYENGVNAFLDFAFSNVGKNEKIRCPCVSCYLGTFHDRKVVFYDLLARGIIKDYNPWTQHGEDEIEEESIPDENHMLLPREEPLLNPCIVNKIRDFHEDKAENGNIHQREKEILDVHQENNEDEDGGSPIISPNVWTYVNAIGTSKTGGDVRQENDDDDDDDNDNGDQDVSIGEDNNFTGVNDCDSSPHQSSEDMNIVATEAEQAAAERDLLEAAQTANSGKRKKYVRRGPRGLKRKKAMEKSTERVKVELPANLGRVVGSNARQFVVEGNWLLKQTLPPNVEKWKDLDPNDVAKLLEKVKDRFIFPNESHVDTALLWQFKQWFRHWRSDLRRVYFNQDDTYEEQLASRPPYIQEAHWKWLVDYWNSDKFRNLSAINTRIRSGQKSIGCSGPTSIARHAYELENNQSEQDSDQRPVYLKLFEKQKRKGDGAWINKEAEDGYNKLVKLHKTQIENHGEDNLTPAIAFNKLFSKAKAINLLGLGENPIAFESSSKRKQKGSSVKTTLEGSVSARLETRFEPLATADKEAQSEEEETQSDKEAQSEEGNESDRESQMRAEIREQVRLFREEMASSSR